MKICLNCNKEFIPKSNNQKFCCPECTYENRKKQKKIEVRNKIKICAKCNKPFTPKPNGQTRRCCFDCVPEESYSTGSSLRILIKQWSLDYKGHKCEKCGYNKCDEALEFHHIEQSEKDFCISDRNIKLDWEEIKKELDKCILLCANCHREEHAKEHKENKEQKNAHNAKKVKCLNNNLIFNSLKEAANYAGLTQGSHIASVCNGKRETSGKDPETGKPLEWAWA